MGMKEEFRPAVGGYLTELPRETFEVWTEVNWSYSVLPNSPSLSPFLHPSLL